MFLPPARDMSGSDKDKSFFFGEKTLKQKTIGKD